MSWETQTPLAGILLGYLAFLFVVAAVAERAGSRLRRLRTVTYVLAVSVYCTRCRREGGRSEKPIRGRCTP